jgi:hypothetical protein
MQRFPGDANGSREHALVVGAHSHDPLALLPGHDETGKSAKTCQAPFAKIFLFFRKANQV